MNNKKVLIISDLHCGSLNGLTPPDYYNSKLQSPLTKTLWKHYKETIKSLGKIDICIVNGDCVDGPGKKGTFELLTTDMSIQRQMAIDCISETKAKKYYFTAGSPFHVTTDEEHEHIIAKHFNSKANTETNLDVNGLLFNFRHHTGKTGTATGQGPLLAKQSLWSILKANISGNNLPDVVIRSHVHEYFYTENSLGIAITTPCLQLPGSSYGRRFNGFYDLGCISFNIKSKTDFSYDKHILRLSEEKDNNYLKG